MKLIEDIKAIWKFNKIAKIMTGMTVGEGLAVASSLIEAIALTANEDPVVVAEGIRRAIRDMHEGENEE